MLTDSLICLYGCAIIIVGLMVMCISYRLDRKERVRGRRARSRERRGWDDSGWP